MLVALAMALVAILINNPAPSFLNNLTPSTVIYTTLPGIAYTMSWPCARSFDDWCYAGLILKDDKMSLETGP